MVALAGKLTGCCEVTCQCDDPTCTRRFQRQAEDAPAYLPQDVIVVAPECLSRIPEGFMIWEKRPGYLLCGPKKVPVVCQCNDPHCHHQIWMTAKMFSDIRLTDQIVVAKECCRGGWPGMVVAHRGKEFTTYTYKS